MIKKTKNTTGFEITMEMGPSKCSGDKINEISVSNLCSYHFDFIYNVILFK